MDRLPSSMVNVTFLFTLHAYTAGGARAEGCHANAADEQCQDIAGCHVRVRQYARLSTWPALQ
eukprot:4361136-Lingulodinium_polyedra.AAC.1